MPLCYACHVCGNYVAKSLSCRLLQTNFLLLWQLYVRDHTAMFQPGRCKQSSPVVACQTRISCTVHAPLPCLLTAAVYQESLFCRLLQTNFLLLWHAKRGVESPLHPWIQSLPTSYDTLVHWTPSQLDELQLVSTSTEKQFRAEVSVLHLTC